MSDQNVVPFGTVKALTQGDNTAWTPRDMIADLLGRIDRGELDIRHIAVVFHHHLAGDGPTTLAMGKMLCNLDRPSEIALYEVFKHHALHDWYKAD